MKLTALPKLETKRLTLRQLKKDDHKVIQFLRSNETVNTYVKRPKTNSTQEAIDFITKINTGIKDNDWLFWGITQKESSELIGTICLWNFSEDRNVAEVGYDLHPDYQGQGVMNEALQAVLEYGFDSLNLDIIEAYTHRDNEPSKRLLFKNNFQHIIDRTDSANADNIIFTLDKKQYA